LLLLALCFGAWSTWGGTGWGYGVGWGPLGFILVLALVLYFAGVLR
jgi:hypothetical protein